MVEPFRTVPVPRRTLLDRLLQRPAAEQALAELTNLLAHTGDVTTVGPRNLDALRDRHGVDPRIVHAPQLRRLYREFLEYCLADRHLSESELEALGHLRALFRLPDSVVRRVHEETARQVYGATVNEAVADGRITAEERLFLHELQQRLTLPPAIAQRIIDDAAHGRLRAALASAADDDRLSDREHDELRAMARNMGAVLRLADEDRAHYDRLRLYWAIENTRPEGVPCDIELAPGELCLDVRDVRWHEGLPPDARRYGSRSPAAAATAIFLRPLSVGKRRLPVDAARRADTGVLSLTTRRIEFRGAARTVLVRLTDLSGMRPFANGVELLPAKGGALFAELERDVDLFALRLHRALRDVWEPELPVAASGEELSA